MKNKYSIFSIIKNSLSYHENWQRAWRDPEPKPSYDIVIVGGGGHGLATAYYLAKEHNLKNYTKKNSIRHNNCIDYWFNWFRDQSLKRFTFDGKF